MLKSKAKVKREKIKLVLRDKEGKVKEVKELKYVNGVLKKD